jgi:DNA-binding NtrC family response regulator
MSDLPLPLQAKLLRALQERRVRPLGGSSEVPFDVRVIVATARDLQAEVARGRFRADLYFRLKVIEIRMPSLRELGGDVLLLAHYFLRQTWTSHRKLTGVTDAAARALCEYHWPGNVRELAHCMTAAAAVARYDRVTEADLPSHVRKGGATAEVEDGVASLRDVEQRHILKVMTHVHGNKSRACRILGLDRKTLLRKLENYANPAEPSDVPPVTCAPHLSSPSRVNPGLVNPGLVNPGLVNPGLVNPGLVNPGLVNASSDMTAD